MLHLITYTRRFRAKKKRAQSIISGPAYSQHFCLIPPRYYLLLCSIKENNKKEREKKHGLKSSQTKENFNHNSNYENARGGS